MYLYIIFLAYENYKNSFQDVFIQSINQHILIPTGITLILFNPNIPHQIFIKNLEHECDIILQLDFLESCVTMFRYNIYIYRQQLDF